MKKLIVLLTFVSFALMGCHLGQVPPSEVCPPPEGQQSWLCDRSADLDITLEQAYGWIYAPIAGGVIFDKLDQQEICEFDDKIAEWYVRNYPFTYDRLILEIFNQLKLVDDPMKLALLTNILNRNLNLYSSPLPISAYDDMLIRGGNEQFRRDMFCD